MPHPTPSEGMPTHSRLPHQEEAATPTTEEGTVGRDSTVLYNSQSSVTLATNEVATAVNNNAVVVVKGGEPIMGVGVPTVRAVRYSRGPNRSPQIRVTS